MRANDDSTLAQSVVDIPEFKKPKTTATRACTGKKKKNELLESHDSNQSHNTSKIAVPLNILWVVSNAQHLLSSEFHGQLIGKSCTVK
ncbi:hypothetical protein DPV78_005714 [Talaromyces pinophilus]|nr:hypothetical protein DPV78_005714 [Talaromyces pinophilus]